MNNNKQKLIKSVFCFYKWKIKKKLIFSIHDRGARRFPNESTDVAPFKCHSMVSFICMQYAITVRMTDAYMPQKP